MITHCTSPLILNTHNKNTDMSVRLHAARTYKVEWGAGTFGSESENINSLLYNLCENICYNGPAAEYAEDLEIDANDFKEAIERVRSMSPKDLKHYGIELTPTHLAKELEDLYEEADKSDGYIHLCWF